MKTAAIYARVSSDQQKEEKTTASQTATLVEFARSEGYSVPDEWIFEDEGYTIVVQAWSGRGWSGYGIWPRKARFRRCWRSPPIG